MSKAETRADLRAARSSYPCKRGGDAQEDRLAQPGMLEGLTVIRCNFLLRIKLAVQTWRQAWQSCETQTRNHSIAIASCWPPVQTAQRPRESLCCRLHATKPGMATQCELKTWKSVSVCGTLNGRSQLKWSSEKIYQNKVISSDKVATTSHVKIDGCCNGVSLLDHIALDLSIERHCVIQHSTPLLRFTLSPLNEARTAKDQADSISA